MAWPPAWGGERGPSDTIPPNPAFKGTQGAYHCLQEVCVPLPCPVKFSFPPRRLREAGRPQAHCLAPVTSDYASTICRSSKTLCSPPTTTSQAFSVCISFCFYGFWNNLNSQFIFTKENKITVARPFLGVSLDLLNPATHCLPAKTWVNSLQVTYQRVIESLPTAQENPSSF